MKKKIITSFSLLIISILIMSHSAGETDHTAAPGEVTCATGGCHNSFALNSGGGTVTISSNIPASGYTPGQTYSISVVVTKTNTPLFGFDFEAVTPSNTTAGNITVTDAASTQTLAGSSRQNITHTSNGGLTPNSKSFNFNWTAPSTNVGNVTFYAAGNAANNNFNATGDYIYSTSMVIPPAGLITGIINGSPFCSGATGISIPYTTGGGFVSGNVFTAQLSNSTGSFASPTAIGSITSTTSGTIISTVPLPAIAGTGYRIRVISSSPTSTGTTNNSNLTINLAPTTANAGATQSVCSSSTTLTGNTPTSGTGTWSLVSGVGSITTPTNPSSIVTGLGTGNNIFQWTISSAGCSSSTSTVNIYRAANPSIATTAANQTVCANFATLSGNTPTAGLGLWSLVSGSGTITSPSSVTTTATNLGAGANIFKWTISNSPCASTSATVSITFAGSISVANAGPDQTICATSANLSGNTPTAGIGAWSIISGTGTISNPSSPSSAVTGLGIGSNVFRWTISNGACTPTFGDVTITSVSVSPANAGASQSICATSTTLSATNPVYGTGMWSIAAGGATLSAPNSPFTNVSGLTPGVNTFIWTVSNAPCSPSSSTVNITQAGSITSSNAGPDQSICGTSTNLAGNVATIGTGSWSVISGTGTIANPASPTTAVSALGIGNNVFRWTITNGACTPSTDDVTITSVSVSVANAGTNQSVCSSTAALTANTPVYGTGTWSLISGTGTIVSPGNATTSITGLGNGINILRWTISNPPCPSSVSDVTITNCAGSLITTNAISGSPFCSTTSYNVMVSFSTSASFTGFYTAELSDANGSFASPVAIGSGPSSPISAVIPAGTPAGGSYRIRVTNSNPYTVGSDNGIDLSINSCNPNSILIDPITGSPFCASTSYNVSVPFTITGNLTGPFVAELSDASGNFAAPVTIGYSYSSPIGATIPSGTPYGVNYKIRIKDSNSSIMSSPNNSNLSINTCVIGFEEYQLAAGVLVYPNPNNGEFYIEFKREINNAKIEIVNVLGQLVYVKQFSEIKADTRAMFNIPNDMGTICILKIKCNEGEMVRRITRY
ncbi:MAG: choice-of-anchor V domain-containing protein [Bacteroidia bacterium]